MCTYRCANNQRNASTTQPTPASACGGSTNEETATSRSSSTILRVIPVKYKIYRNWGVFAVRRAACVLPTAPHASYTSVGMYRAAPYAPVTELHTYGTSRLD